MADITSKIFETEKNIDETFKKISEERKQNNISKNDYNKVSNVIDEVTASLKGFSEAFENIKQSFKDIKPDITDKDVSRLYELYKDFSDISKKLDNIDKQRKDNDSEIASKKRELLNHNPETEDYFLLQGQIDDLERKNEAFVKIYADNFIKYKEIQKEFHDKSGKDIKLDDEVFKNLKESEEILDNNNEKLEKTSYLTEKIANGTRKHRQELRENAKVISTIAVTILNLPSSIKGIFNSAKELAQPWLDADHAVSQMVKTFGLHEKQLSEYRDSMFDISVNMSRWGKTMKELVETQQKYNETTGRNIMLSEEAYDKQYELNQVIGEENGNALTSGLEIFGSTVERSRDIFEDIYKTMLKTGVSTQKTTKDILNNLKLAQKYNFSDGVRNLMEMSVWAENTRFNISSIESIISKFGTLESTVTASARLQVLGGNFAIGADPLSMMYESLEDPEALARRYNDMVKGMGVFNARTGETRFNGIESMLMRNFADITGQSLEDVRAQAIQANKRQYLEANVINRNAGFTEDQIMLITNKAHVNNEGKFVVTDNRNRDVEVSKISQENIGNISTDTTENDFLSSISAQSRSANERLESIETLIKNQQAKIIENVSDNGNAIKETINKIYAFLEGHDWVAGALLVAGAVNIGVTVIKGLSGFIKDIWDLFSLVGGIVKKGAVGIGGKIRRKFAKPNASVEEKNIEINDAGVKETPKKTGGKITRGLRSIFGKEPLSLFGKSVLKKAPFVGGAVTTGIELYSNSRDIDIMRQDLHEKRENGWISDNEYSEKLSEIDRQDTAGKVSAVGSGVGMALGGVLGGAVGSLAGPIGMVIGGVVGGAIGEFVGKKAPEWFAVIKEGADDMWDSVKEKGIKVLDGIKSFFGGVENSFSSIWKGVKNLFSRNEKESVNVDTPVKSLDNGGVENYFSSVWNGIKNLFSGNEKESVNVDTPVKSLDNGIASDNSKMAFGRINKIYDISKGQDVFYDLSSSAISNDMTNVGLSVKQDKDILYNKLNSIYNSVSSSNVSNDYGNQVGNIVSVEPLGTRTETVYPERGASNTSAYKASNTQTGYRNGQPITIKPLEININGTLNLTADGMGINIVEALRDNPMLVRELSQLITRELEESMNGGRTTRFGNARG